MRFTHLSLFSGIGGIDLAANWAGFETILFCEIDKYCQKVLRKHWPDVPIIKDVRDVTKETVMAYAQSNGQRSHIGQYPSAPLQENGTHESQGSSRVGTRARSHEPAITLLTGGFPCQPVSVAGKRRGKEDDRWLWPEMLRVISEVRPSWVVAENVAGLVHLGLDGVLSGLEGASYEAQTFLIPACAVNASHRRDRIFIVAHAECERPILFPSGGSGEQPRYRQGLFEGRSETQTDVADTENSDWRRADREDNPGRRNQETRGCRIRRLGAEYWAVEPDVGRVAYGIPSRVDRLRCLGNAVVPAQIYPILKTIAEIEMGIKDSEHSN